jgi:hypothetical protein
VAVTGEGHRVLSGAAPRQVAEIEDLMRSQ